MGQIVFQATLGGQVAVAGPNTASSFTLTLPAATDTLVGKATTDTLTNKSISGSTNTLTNIANASLTNSNVTIGSTAISLGGTSTTLAGLTGITSSAITNSGLTSGRVTYAGASGLLSDSANLQFNSNGLGIGAAPNTSPGSPYYNLNVGTQGGGGIISAGTDVYFTNNLYIAGNNYFAWTGGSAYASYYNQTGGNHTWKSSTAAGTGGNVATLTDLMTLKFNGNLGIGTSSPTYKLDIKAGQGDQVRFDNAGEQYTQIYWANNGTSKGAMWIDNTNSLFTMFGYTGMALNFYTNATERMRIDSSGNLLVGTTNTNARLRVLSTASQSQGFYVTHPTSSQDVISCENSATSGNNAFISFYTDATVIRGSITYNRAGGLVVYGTTSDYRAKNISGPITDSGALIDSVPVYMGTMKGAAQERPMFIAHETPAYAHIGEKDAVNANGKPIYQQMDASSLIPVMWAEIQSLRQRIATLENK